MSELSKINSQPLEKTPHKCPICDGKGTVPNGFYNSTNNTYSTNSTATETCKTCHGSGIVWS